MLDELRLAARRQRGSRDLRALVRGCKQLLSDRGEMGGMPVALEVIERLVDLDEDWLDAFFAYLGEDLNPDPAAVLRAAQAYQQQPDPVLLAALTEAAEPPRQELLRRLNRAAGGTAAVLRLRRALLERLPRHPELAGIEADLLHLLSSWFNPGFLQMKRVDWQSPAQLLEKIIHHEAVHQIDGWDDLRRRLQPDRRLFAFFHPALPDEPLIFVEVALLPEMPDAIGPLIDKRSTPLEPDRFRVAAFYSISNCEPGLRGVSLGNFLIKSVALQLKRELPRLKTFCTLSPIPRLAAWLLSNPDLRALPGLGKGRGDALEAARERLLKRCEGDLSALQAASVHERLDDDDRRALMALGAACLALVSPTPKGDPVARFHLDNGARLERLNLRGNPSPRGLKQSFGLMVNYLYDLDSIEAHHARFRSGEVVRSRAVAALL
ncbi:MAG: malonyl-CoA decarboxylase family protein [Rubrivivax sp.]|jgi:malonyl-CoA decarboxylase|nr:malonyl-CoA decarboxylase family protein [Rubrivivax sp.]